MSADTDRHPVVPDDLIDVLAYGHSTPFNVRRILDVAWRQGWVLVHRDDLPDADASSGETCGGTSNPVRLRGAEDVNARAYGWEVGHHGMTEPLPDVISATPGNPFLPDPDADLIEKMAQAIRSAGAVGARAWDTIPEDAREHWRMKARAALAAHREVTG
jgi:hypothetical protein